MRISKPTTVLNKNKIKLPGIFALALSFGFFFWVVDAIIRTYFEMPDSFNFFWFAFMNNIQSLPDVFSRFVALILLVLLGTIAMINRRQIAVQNCKLKMFKRELEKSNDRLRRYLFRDYLTGAINRKPFIDLVANKIEDAGRSGRKFAVLFIDLKQFKIINDTYGHEFGDKILRYTTLKLRENIRKSDFLGRYGGDEFIIGLTNINSKNNVRKVVEKLNDAFIDRVEIENKKISVKFNIGIAIYPDNGTNSKELIRNSDYAMYKAKNSDITFAFYSE